MDPRKLNTSQAGKYESNVPEEVVPAGIPKIYICIRTRHLYHRNVGLESQGMELARDGSLVFNLDETQHVSGLDEVKQLGPVSGGWHRRLFLAEKEILCICS